LIQTATNVGATFGALFGGPIASSLGRWRAIILCNFILIAGCVLTLFQPLLIFVAGRLLYGFSAGLYSFLTPKYISEVAPTEVSGTLGGVSQLACTLGILMPMALGPLDNPDGTLAERKTFILIVFVVPLGIAAVQLALMVFVFKFDTPAVMKQRGELEKLREVMGKIYVPAAVQSRIDEIGGDENETGGVKQITYGDIFTNPKYKRATFVGCSLAMF